MKRQSFFTIELQNGWQIAWDKGNCGKEAGGTLAIPAAAIPVGVFPGYIADNIPDFHRGVGWYWNRFDLATVPDRAQEYFLMLGYTEYLAEYWLNGQYVGRFEGVRLNYEFEVGAFLKEKDNLLAIRIVSPTPEGIDGFYSERGDNPLIRDDNIVSRAASKDAPYGGIFYPVRLASRPRLRSGRIVVRQNWQTGELKLTAELINNTGMDATASVLFSILSPSGQPVWSSICSENVAAGGCTVVLEGKVENHSLWSVDEPNLYSANFTLISGEVFHTQKVDFGFRDFRVKDGFFYLNGKRLFMKSCNYGLTPPPNQYEPWSCKSFYRDIMYLKSLGYYMFRFLVSNPFPEFIEMCDKAGALIYEESAVSWEMSPKNPNMERQFEFHMRSVLRRDINHPSVVVFGISNECRVWEVRNYIKTTLPYLREEDSERLIMLDSGRWDMDMSVGSVSNPGSTVWEHQWGGECPDGKIMIDSDEVVFDGNGGCCPEMGDLHVYPKVPVKWSALEEIRNHGKGFKPCYVSEGGIGTFGCQIRLARLDEQWRGPGRGESAAQKYMFMRARLLQEDFYRYRLNDVYPAPDDLSYWSCRANVYQRRLYNTAIRSNPRFVGFNPGLVDGGVGTAPVDFSREGYRPFLADVQIESLAKLLWCVFINPTNVYAGREFMIEAVLANEDVLYPGEYPVRASITHPDVGCVWEFKTTLVIPEIPEGALGPLAVPVFKEYLSLDVPEGEYYLSVWMERGAIPTGGKTTFFVTKPETAADAAVQMIGLDEKAVGWLNAHGVKNAKDAGKILIGDMPDEDAAWPALYEKVADGAHAIFLKPETLLCNVNDPYNHMDYVPERLPFENKGYMTYAESWYYHPINVLRNHPFFKGLPKGVMDDSYWQLVTPQFIFHKQEIPDEIAAVTLAVPYFTTIDELIGYLSGIALGTYNYGKGRLTLNCFKILDTLGDNPAADRLLLNMIDEHDDVELADGKKEHEKPDR